MPAAWRWSWRRRTPAWRSAACARPAASRPPAPCAARSAPTPRRARSCCPWSTARGDRMLATFCARLALGLVASLLLLPARQLHPRFFRTHFLTALGLLVVATFSAWPEADAWPRGLLAAGTVLALLGALAWTLEPAPGGRVIVVFTSLILVAALVLMHPPPSEAWTFYTPNSILV